MPKTKTMNLAELIPADYNPRKDLRPGDPEFEKLKNSIKELGYLAPITVNERTGRIVGGHQRLKAMLDLGYTTAEVWIVDLNEQQEKMANIALNKISGDWDEEKLQNLLNELAKDESLSLDLTGFDLDEISNYLDLEEEFEDEPEDFDADELAETIVSTYTRTGDVWHLGPHRLAIGDSLSPEIVAAAADGQTMDMVFTDPPYNVAVNVGDIEDLKARNRRTDGKIVHNDAMSDSEFYKFLLEFYKRALEITKPGGPIYVCHADSEGLNFRRAMIDAGWELKQNLIWVKNTIVMGRQDYQWQHEPILYGWKPGAAHFWNGARDKSTVYDDEQDLRKLDKKELIKIINELRNDRITTVFRQDKPHRSEDHPTMKPLELCRYYIRNSSIRGHRVWDSFMGSGSTLIASEQLGRICHGVEMDLTYSQVIIERYINLKKNGGEDVFVIRDGEKIPYSQARLLLE